jgi:GNAT superfamily N-acetyltransferase
MARVSTVPSPRAAGDISPQTPSARRPSTYPSEFEREVTLRGGETVGIRPILPDDDHRLIALYGRLSRTTAYQRFFTAMSELPADWAGFFAHVDYGKRMALVAEDAGGVESELIAVARYEGATADLPEVALLVRDDWQGRGLGAILLDAILRAGQSRGMQQFRAFVLADNDRMLRLLTRQTDIKQRTAEDGVVTVVFEPRGSHGRPDDS